MVRVWLVCYQDVDTMQKRQNKEKKKTFVLQLPHFYTGLDAVVLNKTVTVKKIINIFVQQSSNMQQELVAHFERFHNSDF